VPNIKTAAILKAAGTIATVEARHAGWIRSINSGTGVNVPAPRAFDQPKTRQAILNAVKATGFIVA
jgi:hypothetical protein